MLRRPLLFAGAAAIGFGACSARALSLSSQTDLSFKARFRGQLGPPRPTAAALAAGATDTGPLSVEDGVVYQGGAFSSLWIRVGCAQANLVSASALDELVSAALAKQCTLPKPGAVYVALSERSIDAAHVRCLLDKGFRFYHHRTSPEGEDELVYYAWPDRPDFPDKVPPYATSTEGVGAILLSPDERRVLLVWEYGCWKMPTGAVDAGESALSALRREVLGLGLGLGFRVRVRV